MLILIHYNTHAQTKYRFSAPDSTMMRNGEYFRVLPDDTLRIADTSYWVSILSIDQSEVAKTLHQFIRQGRKVTFLKKDSIVVDTILHDSFQYGFSAPRMAKLILYPAKDTFPAKVDTVHTVLNYPTFVSKKTADTASTSKPPFFTLSGRITTIAQLSDNRNTGQGFPQNYLRTFVNTTATIGGLPINMDYTYTTESNSGLNRINSFRFSFDYQTFYSNIKRGIQKGIDLDKGNKLHKLTNVDIDKINKDFALLSSKHQSKSFRKQFDKYKKLLELGEQDTSFKKTFRYKRASAFFDQYKRELALLDEYNKLKAEYYKYKRLADAYGNLKELDISRPAGFKKAAAKYGYQKPGLGLLLSMRKFDLGTFDPDYTQLVLSGVSLTGVNIELNAGKLYGAFTWGASQINFDNPFALDLSGSRTITHGRFGIGRKEKMLMAVSFLKGNDRSSNLINDSFGSFYLPSTNYVLGLDYTYLINEQSKLSLEYAHTLLVPNGGGGNITRREIDKLVRVDQAQYTNAWNVKGETTIMETSTKLKVMARVVDPFYYSFGTPFLRRDNFRLESAVEQPFYKNQLTAGVSYRFDRDNLYDLKEGTSKNNTLIFKLHYKKKKHPFVILIYSPSFQTFYSNALKISYSSRTEMYSVISGYQLNKKNTQNSFTASYTKQFSSSNQPEMQTYHIDMVSLGNVHYIKNIAFSIQSTIMYTHPWEGSDSSRSVAGDLELSKGVFKQKVTIKSGYTFLKDFAIQTRHIGKVGMAFNIKWGIAVDMIFERHFISYANSSPTGKRNTDMHLGRLTVIKTF